ncbi:MAG TPA: CvpA family protein [Ideonella sp.]|nr:CvpA family protein [Ideonella sp.]
MFASFTNIDWALLAVLVLSVLVGLSRGIVFEVISLAGWVVAYFVAQLYGAQLAVWLPVGMGGAAFRVVAGFALAFFGTLIACSLLAKLARALISATPLSIVDRALGAGFGLLRGLVVLLVVTTLVMLTPASRSEWWQASQGATWLSTLLQGLKPMLPADFGRRLTT